MIELFKDGNNMGIRTDVTNPDEFISEISDVLGKLESRGMFHDDWDFQLHCLLPHIIEIYCRLAGRPTSGKATQTIVTTSGNSILADLLVRGDSDGFHTQEEWLAFQQARPLGDF